MKWLSNQRRVQSNKLPLEAIIRRNTSIVQNQDLTKFARTYKKLPSIG